MSIANVRDATRTMVDVRNVTRSYGSGPNATAALRGVSFTVGEGKLVALRGRSGSGKTTLLNVVGGLDIPDGGTVNVAGREVTTMDEHDRMRLRRDTVAYIFQSFGLLPVLSAAENVGVPLRISGVEPRRRDTGDSQWDAHVLGGGQHREQPERLENVGHGVPAQPHSVALVHRGYLVAGDMHGAAVWGVQPADDVEQRGLARAGPAAQRDQLSLADREGHAAQRGGRVRAVSVGAGHVPHVHHGAGRVPHVRDAHAPPSSFCLPRRSGQTPM